MGRDETREVVAHLRECGECTSELVSVAVAFGSLRAARRAQDALAPRVRDVEAPVATIAASDEEQPALQFTPRRGHRMLSLVASIVVVVGLVTGLGLAVSRHATPPISAVAALHHLDAPRVATGQATVRTIGTTRQMDVATKGLPPAPANHYYEVWLLQPSTNKMLPVGVLSPMGSSTYTVAGSIMAQYSAVDISLQANDGTTAHSSQSVLRGSVRSV